MLETSCPSCAGFLYLKFEMTDSLVGELEGQEANTSLVVVSFHTKSTMVF